MRAVAILGLVLFVVGCVPGEGSVRIFDPEELPEDVYASPTPGPTPAHEREVFVYFVRGSHLEAVVRQTAEPLDLPEFPLRALLGGPHLAEAGGGLRTEVPEGAELLSVEVEDEVAEVNLSQEFELSAEQQVLVLRLGQVVFTATELGRTQTVRFLIEGEPVGVVADDGQTYEEVGREHYRSIAPPEGDP